MTATTNPSFFLSKHAHICFTSDTLIILDEANGKYLSISKEQAAKLSPFVLDWPLKSNNCQVPRLLRSLLDRSLITPDRTQGKSAKPPRINMPLAWLQDRQPRGRPPITAQDLYRFSQSAVFALASKRYLPFKKIVSRAQRRKYAAQPLPVDEKVLGSLISVFDWLRPLAFKKTNECFLYCLALNEFLSKYDIHTTWIFAVQSQPFAAHCWLQSGNQALTDIPFNLRRMVPILVI